MGQEFPQLAIVPSLDLKGLTAFNESGVPPTQPPQQCSNVWNLSRCKKQKKKGKCNKIGVARKCKETCDFCGCVDIWSTKKCNKKKKQCGKTKVADLCKKTCGLC